MSQPSSQDSGVFSVPAAEAPKLEVRIPTEQPHQSKAGATGQSGLEAAVTPQPRSEAGATPRPDIVSLGRATVSEVRIPQFEPPRPAVPPKRPADAVAAPPASMRVELPGAVEKKASGRDSTPIPPQPAPIPDSIRVELPGAARVLPLSVSGKSLRVSARKLEFPAACPCCGVPADSSFDAQHVRKRGKRVVRSETYAWTFPYCRVCLEHVRRVRGINMFAGGAGFLAIVAGAALGLALGYLLTGAGIGVAAGGAAYWLVRRRRLAAASAEARSSCICAGPAVIYNGFHGTVHEFEFASRAYAETFERENERKVV